MRQSVQTSGNEKRSKYLFVPPRQPAWQINIEVDRIIFSHAGRQIRKRASAPIHPQHEALNEDQARQETCEREPMQGGGNWNRHDAHYEKQPN